MLTPEPYIATWKRPDTVFKPFGFFLVMWIVTACVVTDEIEFYDKVNMPAHLDSVDPSDDIIDFVANNTSETFTISLWDPDDKDIGAYRARIRVVEQQNTGGTASPWENCNDDPLESIPDPKMYDGGVMVTLKCKILYQLENAPEETTVVVQMIVDDREFEVSSEDEARELQVNWTRQVYPQNTN